MDTTTTSAEGEEEVPQESRAPPPWGKEEEEEHQPDREEEEEEVVAAWEKSPAQPRSCPRQVKRRLPTTHSSFPSFQAYCDVRSLVLG